MSKEENQLQAFAEWLDSHIANASISHANIDRYVTASVLVEEFKKEREVLNNENH